MAPAPDRSAIRAISTALMRFQALACGPILSVICRQRLQGLGWTCHGSVARGSGGDAWGEQDVPLSKSFERYVVRVFKAGVQTRQTTVSEPNWTYTSQMNLADGAGETRIDVAQTSDTYGEGPVVTLTLAA